MQEEHAFERWLDVEVAEHGHHAYYAALEAGGARDEVFPDLLEMARAHYEDPAITAKRVASLGAPETAAMLREYLPSSKTAKSGDLGEILATEFVEWLLDFEVPVRRLRWKDGRNMALRGDDIVAVGWSDDGVRFLKGECKSRARFQRDTLKKALAALNSNLGRPSRHSVLFVATRLREGGNDGLAFELETALQESFQGRDVEHLLFVVSGNDSESLLDDHVGRRSRNARTRYVVGFRIPDHQKFIKRVFAEL